MTHAFHLIWLMLHESATYCLLTCSTGGVL
jgi:hypothetical protein